MKQKLRSSLSRFNPRATLQDYALLITAAIIQSFTFNLFLASSDSAPGGITAIALILNHYTGWRPGLLMLALSVPLIAFGFRHLGRFHFLARVSVVTLIYTLGADFVAPYLPAEGVTSDPLLNALFGGVIGGISTGMAFRGRGTFAGTGIISRIIQLKTGIPTSQLYMMIDGSIIVVVGLVFGWENALYSLIMLFVWGLATDYVLEGPSVVRTVFVITEKPHEVAAGLIERMGIGVTGWEGKGMFSERERSVLFCTISRPDVGTLQNIVSEVDADAFVVIGQGHSARGGVLKRVPPKTKAPRALEALRA